MKKCVKKLSPTQELNIQRVFLERLGIRLRAKRCKAGLSQEELGRCISEDHATISRYENGKKGIDISKLPLVGIYCGFPVNELFPADEYAELLNAFMSAVEIVSKRTYEKRIARIRDASNNNGQNKYFLSYSSFPAKEQAKSLRDKCRLAEIKVAVEPLSDKEFIYYAFDDDDVKIDAVISAGKLLDEIKDTPRKNALRNSVADFIIDELVTDRVIKKRTELGNKRLYAYYKYMFQKYYGKCEDDIS